MVENIRQELFTTAFFDKWNRNYYKLEAYLNQNNNGQLLETGAMADELVEWIAIQSKIKDKLPVKLKSKLAHLKFDFDEKNHLWARRYQQLVSFAKKNGHTHLPADEEYAGLKDWLLKQIQDKSYLSESRFHKLDLLGVDWDIVLTRDQQWEQMYLKLKAFQETFDHCQVPQKWDSDKPLANWVRVQRRLKATNKLRPDRERRLTELKFVWHIQAIYDCQWQHSYQELQLFYQTHGHGRVPGKNKPLTSWIENQRTAKKKNLLVADRERQLNDIGFIWSFKDIKKNNWEEQYKELCAFKQRYGHSFVPINYKENRYLGYWVASQRKLETKNRLEKTKRKKLNQLNFVWSTDTQQQLKALYDAQWNLKFERLKIYLQVYGTCQVSLKINPVLQRWTKWQRKLFYQGRLSEERLAKLNEIRFSWNVQEGYWMKMYEALTDFQNQFGHTRVPYQWAPNRQLADWVYRQKVSKLEMTAQKEQLLSMIGFDWSVCCKTVVSWEKMYGRLLAFKQQYGHTRIPVKWPQDPKLGKWASRMRQQKENLYLERVSLLESIDFNWGYQFANRMAKLINSGSAKEVIAEQNQVS